MKIWVIIPAYNEEAALEDILREVKKKELSVLVIDDGSNDNTYSVAKNIADVAIRNQRNLGKGASLRKGITYLLQNKEFDYVITMDADGQHSPLDIDKFIQQADDGVDCIVGNRMDCPVGMPGIRILTNKWMSGFISKITNTKIPDTQCGFRMIKKEVLEGIIIKTKKYEVESEILISAAKAGFSIKSIPIRSIYFKNSQSKINPFIDTLRFFRFISKLKNGKRKS